MDKGGLASHMSCGTLRDHPVTLGETPERCPSPETQGDGAGTCGRIGAFKRSGPSRSMYVRAAMIFAAQNGLLDAQFRSSHSQWQRRRESMFPLPISCCAVRGWFEGLPKAPTNQDQGVQSSSTGDISQDPGHFVGPSLPSLGDGGWLQAPMSKILLPKPQCSHGFAARAYQRGEWALTCDWY